MAVQGVQLDASSAGALHESLQALRQHEDQDLLEIMQLLVTKPMQVLLSAVDWPASLELHRAYHMSWGAGTMGWGSTLSQQTHKQQEGLNIAAVCTGCKVLLHRRHRGARGLAALRAGCPRVHPLHLPHQALPRCHRAPPPGRCAGAGLCRAQAYTDR